MSQGPCRKVHASRPHDDNSPKAACKVVPRPRPAGNKGVLPEKKAEILTKPWTTACSKPGCRLREIAEVIAGNGPLAVEAILKTLHETIGMSEEEAFAYEQPYGQAVFQSADAKEGPKAFAEKRTPNFQRK